ncbi:MAG: energy transducer TonB [Betaproteobacteria bacterium]|nr:energy transducer TonB [Betaproteobacteria bacterium]
MFGIRRAEQITGLALVLALHAAALWALMSLRIVPIPYEVVTLFVEPLRTEPRPPAPPKAVEKPEPKAKPVQRQLIAEAPAHAPSDPVAEAPPPAAPAVEARPAEPPWPVGPVSLGTELSVVCGERTPPAYPATARRLGEEGTVVLRVELDEAGTVAAARVASGSGHARLDEAAVAAVRNWRCRPALRDGRPIRAMALQPFRFVLQ